MTDNTTPYPTLDEILRAEIERRRESNPKGYDTLLENWEVWPGVDLLEAAALCASGWKELSDLVSRQQRKAQS